MEKLTKCIEFARSTLRQDYKDFAGNQGYHLLDPVRIKLLYPFQITKWTELCSAFHTSSSGNSSIFPYLKSCEYTEKVVKENTELFDLKLQELITENDELKSLVYSSLEQINELKEHNKSLSSRLFELESLLEKKEVPNLIDF
jgi:hypothetical protein